MRITSLVFAVAMALTAGAVALGPAAPGKGIELVRNDAARRVDVLADGQPFTSYIWPASLKKPVLYPIRTASGTPVTRGFPLDPQPGERTDHPHHVGLWFNYGDVNGIDFWNNSDAIGPERRGRMGTVLHREIARLQEGADRAELHTLADWVMPDESVVLRQRTVYGFDASGGRRTIDLTITLTAADAAVAFTDNKEGVLGMRVARSLEEPGGEYLTSEGRRGAAVWGTRGRWCHLAGRVGGEAVSIAILDHPSNAGFPTYWHARGYGLFAANPLGQKELSGGKDVLNFSLAPRQSATFRYRVIVASPAPGAADVESAWRAWTTGP